MAGREQAIAEPRVGDKWQYRDGNIRTLLFVDDNLVTYKSSNRPDLDEISFPRTAIAERMADFKLIERGPTPGRDPYTQPVVGDEWESPAKNWIFSVRSVTPRRIDGEYRIGDAMAPAGWLTSEWSQATKTWRLHRRGDDPAWRPEGERSEQAAAGIKVGDRVRHVSGEEGDTVSVVNGVVLVRFDEDSFDTEYTAKEAAERLTIIPPAAARVPDDTGDEPPTPKTALRIPLTIEVNQWGGVRFLNSDGGEIVETDAWKMPEDLRPLVTRALIGELLKK